MRIVCITSSYPRFAGDVSGLFVHEFCEVLRDGGHDVDVLTWRSPDAETFSPDGIGTTRVAYAPRRWETLFYGDGAPENLEEAPQRALLALPAFAAMLAVAAREVAGADLVIGHWLVPGGVIARMCGWLTGTPALVVGHSGGLHLVSRLPGGAGRTLARLASAGPTTMPTRALAERLEEMATQASVDVLPMGFRPCEDIAGEKTADCWLMMGRMVPIKGFDVGMEALARASGSEATLHVLGDGPERDRLQRRAEELDVDARFHGYVTGSEKCELMARCRYALFPSRVLSSGRHEGFPVSILECMAVGVVPLVGAFPGVRERVPRPDLLVVDDDDAGGWADAVARLRERGDIAELERSCRAASRPLQWDVLGESWLRLVRDAARPR